MADRSRSPDNANFFLAWFKWIAGAAFPANPFLYRPFFRTDLGWLCYWDGTRWLTVHEYSTSLGFNIGTNGVGATATTNFYSQARPRQEYAPYVTRVAAASFVATTNDGANYWSWDVAGSSSGWGTNNTILAWNTSADTVNVWSAHDAAPSTPNPANYFWFSLRLVTKTLNPGQTFANATIFYHLIVT